MLIPIGDDNQGRLSTPFVVYLFIGINIAVFIFLQQAYSTEAGVRFSNGYAVVPYEITTGEDLKTPLPAPGGETVIDDRTGRRERAVIPEAPGPTPIWLTLFTSMFMHGGWMHIIGNMLFLWVFGDNVEDNFGHVKFFIFYIVCGLAASFAQILLDPTSIIPSLGASGAIAGVLGGYIVMFPHNRVRTILPLGFIWTTIELPALVVLGFWIVLQVISQYTASFSPARQSGGVAYMAHIGGFVAGVVMTFFFRRKTQKKPYYDYN
jgi:membrane associated rhomboid family serine protease